MAGEVDQAVNAGKGVVTGTFNLVRKVAPAAALGFVTLAAVGDFSGLLEAGGEGVEIVRDTLDI